MNFIRLKDPCGDFDINNAGLKTLQMFCWMEMHYPRG